MSNDKSDAKYIVIIPMKKSADFVKKMDFYTLFQRYFVQVYKLELKVKEIDENNCEVIFKGFEPAIMAVVQVLKEMGLSPIFETKESKTIDNPTKYH